MKIDPVRRLLESTQFYSGWQRLRARKVLPRDRGLVQEVGQAEHNHAERFPPADRLDLRNGEGAVSPLRVAKGLSKWAGRICRSD